MIAAVIPAAGRSSRMGRPKLLMEFGHQTLIRHVVDAFHRGGVDRVVVTAPPETSPEGPAIAAEAAAAGAQVVVPDLPPVDMRHSVELAIRALAAKPVPERVFLTPGDSPGIRADLVAQLARTAALHPDRIVIPTFEGRRGHPIVLPWAFAAGILALEPGAGINKLTARESAHVFELPSNDPAILSDLDTPDDLRQWSAFVRDGSRVTVTVRLFAIARDLAGCSEFAIETPATVGSLRAAIARHTPALASLMPGCFIAVDEEYARDDTPLSPKSRIAVIPPVSGGAYALALETRVQLGPEP
jgi:molybdenum cofactor cytidylyltransferase